VAGVFSVKKVIKAIMRNYFYRAFLSTLNDDRGCATFSLTFGKPLFHVNVAKS